MVYDDVVLGYGHIAQQAAHEVRDAFLDLVLGGCQVSAHEVGGSGNAGAHRGVDLFLLRFAPAVVRHHAADARHRQHRQAAADEHGAALAGSGERHDQSRQAFRPRPRFHRPVLLPDHHSVQFVAARFRHTLLLDVLALRHHASAASYASSDPASPRPSSSTKTASQASTLTEPAGSAASSPATPPPRSNFPPRQHHNAANRALAVGIQNAIRAVTVERPHPSPFDLDQLSNRVAPLGLAPLARPFRTLADRDCWQNPIRWPSTHHRSRWPGRLSPPICSVFHGIDIGRLPAARDAPRGCPLSTAACGQVIAGVVLDGVLRVALPGA